MRPAKPLLAIAFHVVAVVASAACSSEATDSSGSTDHTGNPGETGGDGGGGASVGAGDGAPTNPVEGNDAGVSSPPKPGTGVPTVPQTGEINCRTEGDNKTTLVFVNRCAKAVTFAGSNITGSTLLPGAFACVDIGNTADPINSKRYWGWTGDDPGPEHHTLAEFTFNTDFHDFDWYNISHVDAHNLPMSIVPVGRPKCHTLACPQDFLTNCPEVGKLKNGKGDVVACVSPDRDNMNSPVALYFEACDDAYAWSGDDQKGTDTSPMRACAGEDWDVVFCPPG